jgi:hypothetical protein
VTIVDLTGKAITELLANAAVTAIVGQKVRAEFASNEGPPAVIVRQLGINYNPGGGTRRLGLQQPMFAALAYGVTRVQASQLANAVVDAMNMRGPRKDASGRLVWQSLVEGGGDVELDPTTGWPFATVTFTYLGAQQAAVA